MSRPRPPCALPLEIPPSRARAYEQIALAVRDQTVALYEDHLHGRPIWAPAAWKQVRQREGVCVYVARDKAPTTSFPLRALDAASRYDVSDDVRVATDWAPQLKLRLVGQTLGSVDDAMYDRTAPTELSMMMRSAAIGDEFVDHKSLLEIRVPTADAPLTHTGLKWSVRSSALASLVKARDLTHVEATGFTRVFHHGAYERVGFVVYHSIELPELPPLDAQHVIRSRASLSAIFRQAAPGVVDIFLTSSILPGGTVPSRLTALQAADSLFAVCKISESAMKRKLVWMLTAKTHGAPKGLAELVPGPARPSDASSFIATLSEQRVSCAHCARALSRLRSITACEICDAHVCSRCVTTQKLVFGTRRPSPSQHGRGNSSSRSSSNAVRVQSLAVCSGCVATARRMDNAAALAAFEFAEPCDPLRPTSSPPSSVSGLREPYVPWGRTASSTDSADRLSCDGSLDEAVYLELTPTK